MANWSIVSCANSFMGGLQPLENINVVYRVLRRDETTDSVKANGLVAKDINSAFTVIEHIQSGKKTSSWISVSASLGNSLIRAHEDKCEIAIIDLKKAVETSEVVDFRDGNSKLTKRYNNYAKSSAELCVKNTIPAEAIIKTLSLETIQEMTEQDYNPDGVSASSFWGNLEKASPTMKKQTIINRVGMLEKAANSVDVWTQDFEKIMVFSQWLWTTNRKLDCPIGVSF